MVEVINSPWTIGEFKDTIRDIGISYYLAKEHYVRGIALIEDLNTSRKKYVAILCNFFSPARPYFANYLIKTKTKEKITIDDYINLPFQHNQFSDQKIYTMGILLEAWYMEEGYFAIKEEKNVYADVVEEVMNEQ